MRIAKLRLKNFKCYRGEVSLELENKVYAIVASKNGDPESSNWAGKSSLLEAIDFALHGRLSKSVRSEDAWITRGEKMGEVEIVFDTGERVVRSRTLGKSTRVYFWDATGANSMQAEAQAHITRLVGLSAEDFLATCYFEQKRLAKIVLSDPSQRMEMISGWFRLEPIQECEESIKLRLNDLLKASEFATTQKNTHELNFRTYLDRLEAGDASSIETFFGAKSNEIETALQEIQVRMDELRARDQHRDLRKQLASFSRRYESIVAEGQELKAHLDPKKRDDLQSKLTDIAGDEKKLLGERALLERDLRMRLAIVENKFDGECPLVNAPCPARPFVESHRKQQGQSADIARQELKTLEGALTATARDRQMYSEEYQKLERIAVRLDSLRQEARQLKPSHERYQSMADAPDEPVGEFEKLRADQMALTERRALLKSGRDILERSKKATEEWEEKRLQLEKEMGTYREALIIFGKNGAQRRIAELALAQIEAGANELLRNCGIPLSVEVQWSREGTGLAANCSYCGAPFPKSEKVKKCSRCASDRGPNLINKLEMILSDRSGAAEDLAGAAIQLSASAWLRQDRTSGWSVAMIDEPFGALDMSNRRAFAAHLVAMLRGSYGFEQAFIVSHTADTQNMTNARIEIMNDGQKSTAKVVG